MPTGRDAVTVSELISLLSGYPSDLRVVVSGYEDGYDDILPRLVSVVEIALNAGKNDWEGDHLDAKWLSSEKLATATGVAKALVLPRTSY